jgi:hypothetical protein
MGVTQGKEPAHFRPIFKGKMIVFSGGNASGFKGASAAAPQQLCMKMRLI